MNETVGQRIAAMRKSLGLSQEALGEKMGVSRQAVNKWESDAAIPEIDKLIGLSRLFGVSLGWLLGVEENAPPKEDPALARIEALLKAQPRQPKWQKPLLTATALCAALSLGLSIYTLNQKNVRESQLEDMLIAAVNYTGAQGELVVEQILPSSLLKDSSIRVSPREDWTGADMTFTLTPDGYTPGQMAQILIFSENDCVHTLDCTYAQGFWTAQGFLEAKEDYQYTFLLIHPDGTEQSETIRAGVLSDLKSQLDYLVQGSCGKVSTRPGYFTLHSLELNVCLPPVLMDISPTPQWEQLELVFFQNGQELYRKDFRDLRSAGDFIYSSGDVSAPIKALHPGDKITLHIQARAEGCPAVDQMILGFQVLDDGSIQEIFSQGN